MNKRVINLAIGLPKELTFAKFKSMKTGIKKQSVNASFLTMDGFNGDTPANLKYHGGLDRALCLFPLEHYEHFENELNIKLEPAAFGENLTVTGMLEEEVCIGDIYQIGEAVIQISEARNPCSTIAKYNNSKKLYDYIKRTGLTGYLARTITPGEITNGSRIKRLKQDINQVTVADCHQAVLKKQGSIVDLERILAIEALSERYYQTVYKRKIQLEK